MKRMPSYLDASGGPPYPSETLEAWAQLAGPGANTHIMQVGERSRLPRGCLLWTERIPKERHLWLTKERPMLPCPRVRTSQGYKWLGQWPYVTVLKSWKHTCHAAIHDPGEGSRVLCAGCVPGSMPKPLHAVPQLAQPFCVAPLIIPIWQMRFRKAKVLKGS